MRLNAKMKDWKTSCLNTNNENTVSKYRKIPKMSPFMYKPLKTSKFVNNAKNPPLNHPSERNQSRGLFLEIAASNAK